MSASPVDLSPFRILVDFFAGAHVALVSITAEDGATHGSVPNWVEFVDPDIGIFGLSQDWELPAGEEDKTLVHGYHVFSGNTDTSPFGTLNLVNLARTLSDHPDPDRTHVVLDHVFEGGSGDPSRSGYLRGEVYRGPPLADVIAHLDSGAIFDALGSDVDSVRTAFQYRRDGVVGLIGAHEQAITVVAGTQKRMRIRIPVVGDDHTPTFELI